LVVWAGPGADQEDFALREWLRCSFGMCMSDRDREVVREAVRERIRPVEEVCVSLVRVVIICLASTHTALVSSPSLAVLHLTTYLPT